MLYDTFERKYRYTMGPRSLAVPFFATQLVPRFVLLATHNTNLVGMAAMKTSSGELLRIKFRPWLRTYRQHAIRSFIIGAPFYFERRKPGVLTLASLSVKPAFRGKGIGTSLIREFIRIGRARGFHSVYLEVIDSNTGAKALYERLGFTVMNYQRIPAPWDRWLGFAGKYAMEFKLDEPL